MIDYVSRQSSVRVFRLPSSFSSLTHSENTQVFLQTDSESKVSASSRRHHRISPQHYEDKEDRAMMVRVV